MFKLLSKRRNLPNESLVPPSLLSSRSTAFLKRAVHVHESSASFALASSSSGAQSVKRVRFSSTPVSSSSISPCKRQATAPAPSASPEKRTKTSDWYSSNLFTTILEGEILCPTPQDFIICDKLFPIWLLSLDVASVKSLHLCNSLSFDKLHSQFSQFGSLWHSLEDKFRPVFTATSPSTALLLASGSSPFLRKIAHQFPQYSSILCLNKHLHSRRLPKGELQFKQLKHNTCGGGTSFSLLWSTRHLPPFLTPSSLDRSVGAFMEHKDRGSPVQDFDSSMCHWSKHVAPSHLATPIYYPSDRSITGFPSCSLSDSELSTLFGFSETFPLAVSSSSLASFCVPLDMTRTLLKFFLSASAKADTSIIRSRLHWNRPSPSSSGHYLPSIGRVFPDTWSKNSTTVMKSAKADDARPEIEKWNLRITSLFPSFKPPVLDWLRRRAMLWKAQKLRKELYVHLADFDIISLNNYRTALLKIYHKQCQSKWPALAGKFRRVGHILHNLYTKSHNLRRHGGAGSSFSDRLIAGREIIWRYCGGYISPDSYMNWERGSTLIFWRWEPYMQHYALAGFPAAFTDAPPKNFKNPRPLMPGFKEQIAEKIGKVIERGYIKIDNAGEVVKNLTDYFAVPKGESDIWIVYNGTSSGLNDVLWASKFWLPMSSSMIRVLNYDYNMVDIDLGEMFLNFPLPKELQEYLGVDLTPIWEEIKAKYPHLNLQPNDKGRVLGYWSRCWMGEKPSPEWAARFYHVAEEFARGKDDEVDNPVGWQEVRLNIIGTKDYDPSLPNVIKWNTKHNRPAGDILSYVDDLRTAGATLEEAWAIARLIASRLQYLGIQDAPRKRRVDGNGPWTGTIFDTSNNKISKTVAVEKWEKAKRYIDQMVETANSEKSEFEFKFLEKARGDDFPYLVSLPEGNASHAVQSSQI